MAFVQTFPRPSGDAPSALDPFSFNHKGRRAGPAGSREAEEEVARQFEALLIQQMLKQARQSPWNPGPFDSDQVRLAQQMRDEQTALQLANPGMGLAQALLEQIRGGSAADQPDPAAREAGATPAKAPVASSISALIDLLTTPVRAVERIAGAIKGAPGHIREFVARMGDAAQHAAAESGVPARLILSQAALESGWGRREILNEDGTNSHNLFGIKATGGWAGKVVRVMTTEYENGVGRKVMQPFRAYASYEESFADYARLISQSERYGEVLTASSAEEAARRIQEAGYATDPAYADKLISIMGYFHS